MAIARVSTLVASFVLSYFLARSLGSVGLGIYSTIISFHSILETICSVGMRSFLTRDIARDLTQTNRYMTHAAIITSGMSLLAILITIPVIRQMGYMGETVWGIIIANLALFPSTWTTIYESAFIAHQKAEFVSYTMLTILVMRISGSIYLLLNGYGVISLIVFQTILQYIAFGISTFFVARHLVVPHWEFDFTLLKGMLKNLRTFTAIGFLSSMLSQLEVLLLSVLQGESAVGIYSAASKLTWMWYVIPESYMRAVFPAMAAAYTRSQQEFQKLVNRSTKYLMAIAFPLGVGIAVTAGQFIPLFYGDGFTDSVAVLQLLAIIFVPSFLNEVLWRILIVRDEQHLALRTQVAGVVTKLGVSLLIVPLLSYMGTAYALLASQVVYTGMHIFFVQRRDKPVPFIHLIWRFALAAGLMGACALWLSSQFGIFVAVPVAIVLYVALLFLLRAFSAEELVLFSSLLRRRKPASSESDSAKEK